MATCFCTGACMRGLGCAARPMGTRYIEPMGKSVTEDQVRRIIGEEIQRALKGPAASEDFNPLPRDADPYLKGEGGNCGHTRVPDNTMCPLCWRRNGEWHQHHCPHDSFEWMLAPTDA